MTTKNSTPCLEFRQIAKQFGSVRANYEVNFSVAPNSIHGIVGENGAGKSTAMKMLYGLIKPDSGAIFFDGQPVHFSSPVDAVNHGIGMVHQHFMLADSQTVLDNILLGSELLSQTQTTQTFQHWWQQFVPIPRSHARQELENIMQASGIRVPLEAHVATLPVGVQQRTEILKLLYRKARVLILDEPTAVLTPQETNELFAMLRKLRDEKGCTILLISHKLAEIKALTDTVTVFRAGNTSAGTHATSQVSELQLATMMVGRPVELTKTYERTPQLKNNVLDIKNFSTRTKDVTSHHQLHLHNLSLHIGAGEIVGIAGVEANGQDALITLINSPSTFIRDVKQASFENLMFHDEPFAKESCVGMRRRGLAIVAPDRHRQAVLLKQNLAQNVFLGAIQSSNNKEEELFWGPFLSERAAAKRAGQLTEEYNVMPHDPFALMNELSGGNQQKFVCARELAKHPKLLIAAHPTRGVDIGAIEFIHQKIIDARNSGVGVLLISSELDELVGLADRIYVMFKGQISGHFVGPDFSKPHIGEAMGGRFMNESLIL